MSVCGEPVGAKLLAMILQAVSRRTARDGVDLMNGVGLCADCPSWQAAPGRALTMGWACPRLPQVEPWHEFSHMAHQALDQWLKGFKPLIDGNHAYLAGSQR